MKATNICRWLANGFLFKRDDRQQKDLTLNCSTPGIYRRTAPDI
ncbi:MAG: hypothetical protein ACLRP3_12435 [Escherichia sp.]